MKRRHLRVDALDLCSRLKARRPEIALGADLIAGFPTETDEQFEILLAFVDEAQLSFLHVFPFSPRMGTPAARMPQVAPALVKARAARLRDKGRERFGMHLAAWVGRDGLMLAERDGEGRLADFTPVAAAGAPAGAFVRVRIDSHDGDKLIGRTG
jgi:threonylcarbamoyladenosine tRNA methylthiotransferase MtaB